MVEDGENRHWTPEIDMESTVITSHLCIVWCAKGYTYGVSSTPGRSKKNITTILLFATLSLSHHTDAPYRHIQMEHIHWYIPPRTFSSHDGSGTRVYSHEPNKKNNHIRSLHLLLCVGTAMSRLTPGTMNSVENGYGIISHPASHLTVHRTWDTLTSFWALYGGDVFTPTSAPPVLSLLSRLQWSQPPFCPSVHTSPSLLSLWRIVSPLIPSRGCSFLNAPFSLIFSHWNITLWRVFTGDSTHHPSSSPLFGCSFSLQH